MASCAGCLRIKSTLVQSTIARQNLRQDASILTRSTGGIQSNFSRFDRRITQSDKEGLVDGDMPYASRKGSDESKWVVGWCRQTFEEGGEGISSSSSSSSSSIMPNPKWKASFTATCRIPNARVEMNELGSEDVVARQAKAPAVAAMTCPSVKANSSTSFSSSSSSTSSYSSSSSPSSSSSLSSGCLRFFPSPDPRRKLRQLRQRLGHTRKRISRCRPPLLHPHPPPFLHLCLRRHHPRRYHRDFSIHYSNRHHRHHRHRRYHYH